MYISTLGSYAITAQYPVILYLKCFTSKSHNLAAEVAQECFVIVVVLVYQHIHTDVLHSFLPAESSHAT